MRCPRESDASHTTPHQMNSQIFHNIESVRDKVVLTDPNLGRSVKGWQGREKMLAWYHKMNHEKMASSVQMTFDKFFTEK